MTTDGLQLRPATIEDLPRAILPIERASQPHPWSEKAFLAELDNPVSEISVAQDGDGNVVGFLVTWQVLDEVHLLNVAVAPEHRRRGIGRWLVQQLLERALDEKSTWVSLEVRVSNAAAIALYDSLGFVLVGRRREYYADNDEDALLLAWTPETGASTAPHTSPEPTPPARVDSTIALANPVAPGDGH